MQDFYYQIKGKIGEANSFSNWAFPPIFSGKVTARDKKQAKAIIEEEYGKSFPLRVLQKDLESNEFLLNIEAIKPGSLLETLFLQRVCKCCESTFYVIDKYNDQNVSNKGPEYCSDKCRQDSVQVEAYVRNEAAVLNGSASPVIYKITNKETGKCYIGKTTQVFTLRWYQHFYQSGSCKFHEAIKSSKISDWVFEVIEIISVPEGVKTNDELNSYILDREMFYIKKFNSISFGYNSVSSKAPSVNDNQISLFKQAS